MILKFSNNPYETEIVGCHPGSETAYNYSLAIDENGDQYLEAEEYNIQEVTNSFAEECSITRIIQAHGLGDELLLNQKPGVYLDEEQVNTIKNSGSSNLELNTQLLGLYQGYKDVMSFDDFANAVAHGDFTALENAKKPKVEGAE